MLMGLHSHCCFLLLTSLLNSQGLKDFSVLKARLCQHQCTQMFEPTLILLKVCKTQLPLPLLLLLYTESTKHRRSKTFPPSHWDAAPKSCSGASCAPCLRKLNHYLPGASSGSFFVLLIILGCVPPETTHSAPSPRNSLPKFKPGEYPGSSYQTKASWDTKPCCKH